MVLRGVESLGVRVTAHPGGTPPGSAAVRGVGQRYSEGGHSARIGLPERRDLPGHQRTVGLRESRQHHAQHRQHRHAGELDPGAGQELRRCQPLPGQRRTYFVATGANGLPALFRRQLRADAGPPVAAAEVAEELVDGVRDFQVFFGIDTTGDRVADQYVPASAGWTPNQAVAVRVTLLLMSNENNVSAEPGRLVYEGGEVYDLSGNEYEIDGRPDRHMYRVFTTTVGLRNRLP
ncbi:MAG: PilW family protein [Gammaproteobacteria bacterium]|nr:PilW family protein [Gammaproteobacteria bacterium]